MILIMMELKFLCKKKILARLKRKIIFSLMCFLTKTSWFFQSTFQIKNLKIQQICCKYFMVINHIACTSKVLTDLCFTKQRIKTKNTFVKVVYSVLVAKKILTEHKEVCLSINGAQSVRLEKGTTEFILKKYQFHSKFILIFSVI